MRIYIDEGGHFTENAGISVVCSLALPHETVEDAKKEIDEFTRDWPRKEGELKGGLLSPRHLKALVAILYRHDALLQCIVTDVSRDSQDEITRHRKAQCDGITKYLTPDHTPDFVTKVNALRQTLEGMSNQLYVQCVLMSELVLATMEHVAFYFAQRRPYELSTFVWKVDAKDPKKITTQEKWWRDTLGPLGESKSRQRPFGRVDHPNFDYSYFDRSFAMETVLWWPDKPREKVKGVNIKKLITDTVSFEDSRSDTMLQTVDILANYMRRVLMGEVIDPTAIRSLGKLQIIRNRDGLPQAFEMAAFIANPSSRRGLGKINAVITNAGRRMLRYPLK